MRDIQVSEAKGLLAQPLVCNDAPEWRHNRERPGLATMECGLVSKDGSRAGLHVVLQVGLSSKTQIKTYKFTVFRMNLGAAQRVYQLHINAIAHAPKCLHDFAHEHFGDAREIGAEAWLEWSFQDALDYFCKRANIEFIPPLNDPFSFELRPS